MSRTHRGRTVALLMAGALAAASLIVVAAPAGADAGAGAAQAPKHGGSVNFALEAETNDGYCLPQSTLAASGIQVVAAVYDSLTTLNSKGQAVPYLAKTITPNANFTQWTIALRPGVKFHDGTPVDAAAVKLNLDTYRGKNPTIPVQLTVFVFSDIASVDVVDPLTVSVTMKTPWVAFPAYLVNRYGIMAPAQLANPATCATNLIGSGPFTFVEWRQNELLRVKRNPNYWQTGLPYLNEIVFRPVPEAAQRVNGLTSGQFDLISTSSSSSIVDMQEKAKNGDINLIATDKGAETAYLMLNSGKAPFDDIIARQAVAYAGDANEVNQIRNRGLNTISTGPFPPGNMGYLKNNVRIHNLKKAKALNKEYEQKHGQPISFEYLTNPEPETVAIAELVKEQQAKAGINVSIRTVDQAGLIHEVIAGTFQGAGFRNHPGGDPDTQYVWWHSGSPVNFGRINDPVIDADLDQGRVEPDPAKRTKIYEDLNRRFTKELYNLWSWYTYWAIGYAKNVKGVTGVPLPDGAGRPFALFAGIIPVTGISKT